MGELKKYIYTQHGLGHLMFPELDGEGKVVMIPADEKEVAAAKAKNAANAAKYKQDVANWKPGKPMPAPAATVHVPRPMVKIGQEVMLQIGEVYELPADNKDVMYMVEIGYLKPQTPEVASPQNVVNVIPGEGDE